MLLDDPLAEVRGIDRRSGLQSGTTVAPDHGGEAMRRHLLVDAAALLVALMPVAASAQPADPDASRLRTLFFQRDFESAVVEGA